jgi:hypothetical protein
VDKSRAAGEADEGLVVVKLLDVCFRQQRNLRKVIDNTALMVKSKQLPKQ